jgi:5-(carboxyamino)imidazole ribonucleotide synthase
MHETYDCNAGSGNPLATGPRLGIIGGGQLARMTTIAAQQLGWDVVVLENNPLSPAATFASHSQ